MVVRVILTKQDDIKDQIDLTIDTFDTPTARKWRKLLKRQLASGHPVKKHVSSHGWIKDKSRTLEDLVNEVNYTIDEVNKFNFAKAAYEQKNTTVKKDFNVDLKLSVDKLLKGKDDFNLDIVNELHDRFVTLEGAKTIEDVDSTAPYFNVATPEIRWRISKLNNLSHELFHWGNEMKRWNRVRWYGPEIHVHYYNTIYEPYEQEDNLAFNLRYDFGKVSIGDPTVGKLYWDAFNDQDDHITNAELFTPMHMVPDFHMYFGVSSTQEQNKMLEAEYVQWLYSRGLEDHAPAKSRIGRPWVGEIDFRKSFGTTEQDTVVQHLTGYNNIYAIIVDDKFRTYGWTMKDEEIDIKQHA